jgi:hypothetical protein
LRRRIGWLKVDHARVLRNYCSLHALDSLLRIRMNVFVIVPMYTAGSLESRCQNIHSYVLVSLSVSLRSSSFRRLRN